MDTVIDENPILVDASGSESFGFSCTRNSGMSGFGLGAAQDGFTRILDIALAAVMIESHGYEDTLDIHACESFGCS